MSLIEILIGGVGAGVAKGVVKLWWKDEDILRETGISLIDVFKGKTRDFLAARAGQRQFDRISEAVATSVLELFDREGVKIDEGGKIAVARAAGETIQSTPITTELLLDRHLDPKQLEELFLTRHVELGRPDPARHFGEAEGELYRRILSEASVYIVDIASEMPTFTSRSIGEILKREDRVLKKAERILDEVRRIREAEDPSNAAARFETDYRLAVVRRFDSLELFGVDASEQNRRYRLSVAYVSLSVERTRREGNEGRGEIPEEGRWEEEADWRPSRSPEDEEMLEGYDDREVVPIETALASRQRLFIRGPAGSGKTTLLQWIAVGAASRRMEGELAEWNDVVPFFLRLRESTEQELPGPESFPALVTRAIAAEMPKEWVHSQLRSGRAVVLVDGLDEIHKTRRREVRDWLADLTASFPETRFLLSSRPHAVDEGWLNEEDFDEAELQEMTARDVDAFIDHWHEAIKDGLQDEEQKAELGPLADSLRQTVRTDRALRRLVTSPLLCAMLCVLHRDRRQRLPKDRIELYQACCDMFLRRDEERRVSLEGYPELGLRQKRALLEDLAYFLITNGWSEISEEKADQRFERKLKRMEVIPNATSAPGVRRLLVERSGILRQPEAGVIDFAHRTFQEFMAAQAFLDEGMIYIAQLIYRTTQPSDSKTRTTSRPLICGRRGTKPRPRPLASPPSGEALARRAPPSRGRWPPGCSPAPSPWSPPGSRTLESTGIPRSRHRLRRGRWSPEASWLKSSGASPHG